MTMAMMGSIDTNSLLECNHNQTDKPIIAGKYKISGGAAGL